MKLLNTYEDRDDAEDALKKLSGECRLASERDATETIYNLFGIATWSNFHKLDMYNLPELKILLSTRKEWTDRQLGRHEVIIKSLQKVAKIYDLDIPSHWI